MSEHKGANMTEARAIDKARLAAKNTGDIYYVIFEDGEYQIAAEFDRQTFYAGIAPTHSIDSSGDFC